MLLGSIIQWNDSQNSGKYHSYAYKFNVKDRNKNQLEEEMDKVWKGPAGDISISLGHITLLAHQCVITSQGSSPARGPHPCFGGPEFLLGFHQTGMVDQIIDHSSPFQRSEDQGEIQAQSLDLLITWLVSLAQPAPMLKVPTGPP